MSTKTQTDAESNADQPAAESDDVELRRPFLVEASGPAEKIAHVTGSLAEREETEISIVRSIETLAEFDAFYAERRKTDWKTNVVERLLSEESPENVGYEFHADEWDVQVDGRVDAFRGVIDALADPDLDTGGDPCMGDADYCRNLVEIRDLVESERYDEDEGFADLVENCRQSPLFGPGAAIAKMDARHAAREDIEGYLEEFLEDVRENEGE